MNGDFMFWSQISTKWREFFEWNSEKYYEQSYELYVEGGRIFSLAYSDLEKFDPQFAEAVLTNYFLFIDEGKKQLIRMMDNFGLEHDQIHLIIENFPSDCEKALNEIDKFDIGNLVTSEVLVSNVESNRIRYIESVFECKLCKNEIYCEQPTNFTLKPNTPDKCPIIQGGCGTAKRKGDFRHKEEKSLKSNIVKLEIIGLGITKESFYQPIKRTAYVEGPTIVNLHQGMRILANMIPEEENAERLNSLIGNIYFRLVSFKITNFPDINTSMFEDEEIPKDVKDAIYAKFDHRCQADWRIDPNLDPTTGEICGSTDDLTIDHKYPRIFGGKNNPMNLQVLCRSHNSMKGTKLV